jgi:PKD repeat protein
MVNQTPDAISYIWDLGNGATSVQNNPVGIYNTAGDYTVELIAVNTFGCRDTLERIFSAYSIPEADFIPVPDEGCDPLTVQFDNLSRFSTNAFWSFSDGGVSTDFNPTYVFRGPGSYGAQLIASHRDVCFDTLHLNDIISVNPSPVANFSFVEILTMPPSGMFKFTDASQDAVQWDWDFGDGGTSDEKNPEYRYYSNGPKVVTLLVTSLNGCTDDTSQVVTPTGMKGLFIPNAFTPEAGSGDVTRFKPQGVGLKEFEIEVYSPYGQLLWRSDKLNEGQPAEPWDGTFQGQLLPQDVYTWKVTRAIFEDGTIWPGNFDAGTGAGKWVGSVILIR